MKTIATPYQLDIIVAGGGTAGSAAAVAVARRGHKVVLIEEGNRLGGVSTGGYQPNFPSKWMSADGLRLLMVSSGSFDDYNLTLQKVTLEIAS